MSDIKCIRCERALQNIQPNIGFQPDDGLAFYTNGHYGSTFFDPMDGSYLEIAVCDECVRSLSERGFVHGPKGSSRKDADVLSDAEIAELLQGFVKPEKNDDY